jgi:hypothetical protein
MSARAKGGGGGGGPGSMHSTDLQVVVSGGKRAAEVRHGHSLCFTV